MYTILIDLLCLAAAVAAAPATTACIQDNCLRALVGSAFPTKHGAADCSSYFLTTVTPATSTITATATVSPTTTDVATITDTTTVTDTATDVLTDDETTTVTLLPTIVPIRKRDHPDNREKVVTIAPRQMTIAPSSIPAYASPCSGAVRYSNACSCLGVKASTSTASAPSTTITATVTSQQTVLTTETSIATATVDVTATVIDSTVVATQTVTSCGTTPNFILQVITGGQESGLYAQVVSASSASTFNIDAAGHINYGGYYGNIEAGVQHFIFYFNTPADISSYCYVYATCSIDLNYMLQCVDQTSTMFQISPSEVSTGETGAGVVIGAYIETGNQPISFQATCV